LIFLNIATSGFCPSDAFAGSKLPPSVRDPAKYADEQAGRLRIEPLATTLPLDRRPGRSERLTP
jgi:hypothetical protein